MYCIFDEKSVAFLAKGDLILFAEKTLMKRGDSFESELGIEIVVDQDENASYVRFATEEEKFEITKKVLNGEFSPDNLEGTEDFIIRADELNIGNRALELVPS